MFERFTEPARRALFFARYETTQLGATSIGTEHLLLGLIRDPGRVLSRVLDAAHLAPRTIRSEIESRSVFRERIPTSVEIPFSAEAKRALDYAAEEADRLAHQHIAPEHLLLGLVRVDGSVAASTLAGLGAEYETVREIVMRTPPSAEDKDIPPLEELSLGTASPAEISEQLDRVQRLVQQLHRRFADDKEAHVLFERIDEELDLLKQRLAGRQ